MVTKEDLLANGYTELNGMSCTGDLCCKEYFQRLTDRYSFEVSFWNFPGMLADERQINLGFDLIFDDHILNLDIRGIPDTWDLSMMEEYVRRCYLLLDAKPHISKDTP